MLTRRYLFLIRTIALMILYLVSERLQWTRSDSDIYNVVEGRINYLRTELCHPYLVDNYDSPEEGNMASKKNYSTIIYALFLER